MQQDAQYLSCFWISHEASSSQWPAGVPTGTVYCWRCLVPTDLISKLMRKCVGFWLTVCIYWQGKGVWGASERTSFLKRKYQSMSLHNDSLEPNCHELWQVSLAPVLPLYWCVWECNTPALSGYNSKRTRGRSGHSICWSHHFRCLPRC